MTFPFLRLVTLTPASVRIDAATAVGSEAAADAGRAGGKKAVEAKREAALERRFGRL